MNREELRSSWDRCRLIRIHASKGRMLVVGKLDITDDSVHFGLTGGPREQGTELTAFLAARGLSWPYTGVQPVSFEELMTQVECALDLIGKADS